MTFIKSKQKVQSNLNIGLLITLSLLIFTTCVEKTEYGRITGVITDSKTNVAIADAAVKLMPGNTTVTTKTDGKYEFVDLSADSYTISVTKTGYQNNAAATKTILLNKGQSVAADFQLAALARISGKVTDAVNNQAIGSASISISPGNQTITSASDGTYAFSSLTDGEYTITITKSGYQTDEASTKQKVAVFAGDDKILNFQLKASKAQAVITGKVTNADNTQAIAEALVSISPANQTINTAIDGTYTISNLSDGEYTITVTKTGFQTDATSTIQKVTVAAGDVKTINFQLKPTKPIISVNTQLLSFADGETTKKITISNTGVGNLDCTLATSQSWISISIATVSGISTSPSDVTITVNRTGLAYGSQTGSVVINSNGGNPVTITINMANTKPADTPPSVTTGTSATNVTTTSAQVSGSVTAMGTANVTDYGHCWSTTNNPTTSNFKTSKGALAAAPFTYSSDLTGLLAGTTYYVKAYASSAAGTTYGSQVEFKTSAEAELATVNNGTADKITHNSATMSGTLVNTGNDLVSEYGHVWSTSNTIPTISDSKTNLGSSSTNNLTFNSSLTGLKASTTYNVRAYAKNSKGINYSSVIDFTTKMPVPTSGVVTGAVSNILNTTATVAGAVNNIGIGVSIVQHGHCWSSNGTDPLETLTTKTTLGALSATGNFPQNSSLNSLTTATTYKVRAYIKTSDGAVLYGDVVSFTTK